MQVALNLVLNYEEGENCLLHGDGESEKLLSEIVGAGAIGEIILIRDFVSNFSDIQMTA